MEIAVFHYTGLTLNSLEVIGNVKFVGQICDGQADRQGYENMGLFLNPVPSNADF